MAEGTGARAADVVDGPTGDRPAVAACATRPGRLVFIEDGNTEGWIATDAAVPPER